MTSACQFKQSFTGWVTTAKQSTDDLLCGRMYKRKNTCWKLQQLTFLCCDIL